MIIHASGQADGLAQMSPEDMASLHLEEMDVVNFHSGSGARGSAHVVSSEKCGEDTILVDDTILAGTSIAPGTDVSVEKSEVRGGITLVKLGVLPAPDKDVEQVILWIAENIEGIADILKNRPIFNGLEATWGDTPFGDLTLRVIQTEPAIDDKATAIIDTTGIEVIFEIAPLNVVAFNTILLIDVSGSMNKDDLLVEGMAGEIASLRDDFQNIDEIAEFLGGIGDAPVARVTGAALATLLYTRLKVGRGLGEHVQVITFGDVAEILEIENKEGEMSPVIECTGRLADLNISTIAWYIVEKSKNATGLTAMSSALKVAADQVEQFSGKGGEKVPTMIILLSDGNPNMGDEEAGIPVNPIPVAREHLSKKNVAIFTIGLGEANDILMQKLAEDHGRGIYYRARSLKDLWGVYDNLAQQFFVAVKSRAGAKPATSSEEYLTDEDLSMDIPEDLAIVAPEPEPKAKPEPAPVVTKTPKKDREQATTKVKQKVPNITVYLMTTIGPGEKNVAVTIEEDAPVADLKNIAGGMFALNPFDFHLVCGGVTMDELKSVKAYGVKQGSTILLIPASTAGRLG